MPPPEPAADDYIVEVRIEGNERTRPEIILQELLVCPGAPATPRIIEESRQAVMDLGLFRSVRAELVPAEQGGQILVLRVEEKRYFLPIPRLDRTSDGDLIYGAQLRFDNLGGLNQRLRLTYRIRDYEDSDRKERVATVAYSYPRIAGTPYQIDVNLREAHTPQLTLADLLVNDDETGLFRRRSHRARLVVSRWARPLGPSIGWRFGGGVNWDNEDIEPLNGVVPPEVSGQTFGLVALAENHDMHDLLYSRQGRSYGYNGEYGLDAFSADYDYTRHFLFYRRYHPLGSTPHQSLHFNLETGFSSGRAFGRDAYSLGGGGSLRGYERDSFTGAAYLLANTEVLTPLFGQNSLRGAAFVDLGNAYATNGDFDPTDLHAGVGVGLRWKLTRFVDVELLLDVAYGDRDAGVQVYGHTSAMF